MINDICVNQGIGCSKENRDDIFVVNRNVNNPELMFNQRLNSKTFFELDFASNWRLAGNDCYTC